MLVDHRIRYSAAMLVILVGTAFSGCESGSKSHPVAGRVEILGGMSSALAGHHVELSRTDDTTVRAAGVINETGQFHVETLEHGQVTKGVREGTYHVRLLLVDEGDGTKKPKVPRKYLDFKTSGWTVQVPPHGDVNLTVTTK